MKLDKHNLVLIIGVMPRSGTNYIFNALMLHSDIQRVQFDAEDKIFVESDLLLKYVRRTKNSWYEKEGIDLERQKGDLQEFIGKGISDFLAGNKNGVLLNKTPLTQGLKNIHKFIPNTKIIILLRSGRDLIESGRKSFGWPYDEAIVRYKKSLNRIKNFLEETSTKDNVRLIRYEDVLADEAKEVEQLIRFVGLDVAKYPFGQLATMGVTGSSTTKGLGNDGRKNYKSFKDKSNFNPTERSKNWPKPILRMYNRECGDLLEYFNYERESFNDNAFLRFNDSVSVLFKNLGGVLKRSTSFNFAQFVKKIRTRIANSLSVLIFGYIKRK